MMGFKIALTGIVIALFCMAMGKIAISEPKQPSLVVLFGLGLLAGLVMIPVGFIIQIWQ